MSQPIWKFVANLGDVNPLEHGGLFVYRDETGVYAPEMERIEMIDEEAEEGSERYEIHRVTIDRCTFVDGVLSDNEFHPGHAAWFASNLTGISESMDYPINELRNDLCSEDPVRLANAYRAVLDYHGWCNGNAYPLILTREEAEKRYSEETTS